MPAKKSIKKSVVKKKQVVSKAKPKKSTAPLPKVKLKSQPILVRRSITYVFVSSLLLFFFVSAYPNAFANIFYPTQTQNNVLGEDDENKNEESNKVEDEDKDEDEDEVEIEKVETEHENEVKPSKSVKPSESTRNKSNTQTSVKNADGTTTVTKTETDGAKIKTETTTFSATGLKVGESKLETQENETEIKSKTKGDTGVESKFEFKDKNGAVVMLKVREGDNSWSHLMYNEKNGMLLIKQKGTPTVNPSINITLGVTPKTTPSLTPDVTPLAEEVNNESTQNTLAIKINNGGTFDLIKGAVSASTNLPVEVDGERGMVYVNNTEVTFDPEEVVNTAKTTEGVDTVEAVSITKQNGVTTYMVKGVDSQKFLGVFDVTIPKTLYYSVDTNTMISSSKTMIQNVIDAFSF